MTLEITEPICGKVAPESTARLIGDKWPVKCFKAKGHDEYCQGRSGIWDIYWNPKRIQEVFAHAQDKSTRKP